MVYLVEKERIAAETFSRVSRLLGDTPTLLVEIPLDLKIARAVSQVDAAQIPDLPDRIVAATALSLQVPLISRDTKIQLSSIHTIW